MKKITERYRIFLSEPSSLISLAVALLFLLASLVVNYFASQYAYVNKSNSVTDILLDNLPVVNMDTTFIVGTIIFIILVTIFLILQPHKISFVLKSIALFIVVRSLFVTLTHIGPSPLNTLESPGEIGRAFSSGADLFFSGHTGMPFLFSLMYWYDRRLRFLFFFMSIIAAVSVLLGHIHYSIDVASAYFITYGIHIITKRIYARDFEEFKKEYPQL